MDNDVLGTLLVGLLTAFLPAALLEPGENRGLTAVAGIKVGHSVMPERPTGCTVILTEAGAVAAVDVRGGGPATHETDLLDPVATVQHVHGIVFSGGSAFGLAAAGGVMRYLEEHGIGFDVGVARVPIVPAASLFDLGVGGRPDVRPAAKCGYQAAKSASDGPVAEGNVGAGAGATVGKLLGPDRAMKAGLGSAALVLPSGLVVAALAAVNAIGQVMDPDTGKVMAGVRTPDGAGIFDLRPHVRAGAALSAARPGENTTLGVVATNAVLTRVQATKMAQMAHDGLARAIYPAHLPLDGDTVFALATGTHKGEADLNTIGALAAEALAQAIVRAATLATGIPGFPAAQDLGGTPAHQ